MARLGYDQYFAQGGDWGAAVTMNIGMTETVHCAGIHTNMPLVDLTPEMMANPTDFEKRALAGVYSGC